MLAFGLEGLYHDLKNKELIFARRNSCCLDAIRLLCRTHSTFPIEFELLLPIYLGLLSKWL